MMIKPNTKDEFYYNMALNDTGLKLILILKIKVVIRFIYQKALIKTFDTSFLVTQ